MHRGQTKMNNYFNRLPQGMQRHCQRTGQYMRMVLMAMDLGALERALLWRGLSPFDYHDIGKILLPESLMEQAGSYTVEESLRMMGHVDYGQQIFCSIGAEFPEAADFCKAGEEIALFHHECWDGTGYPDGRSGEEIPFLARVCAIANAYTGTLEGGTQRPGHPVDIALQELLSGGGSWFDPEIVGCFVDYVIKGEAITGRTVDFEKR